MLIKRKSPVTGKENTMDIDITAAQIIEVMNGRDIKRVCPNLDEQSIVFFTTGKTLEEQNYVSEL